MMRILKKRRISTERETITHIFMREKAYGVNWDLSTENSTMPRMRILMNTRISKKRRTWAKNNVNSSMKKMTITTMIIKKMNMRRKSGTRSLTGSSLWTL